MRILSLWFVVVVVASCAEPAWADGLLYKLPKDGSWVRFDMKTAPDEPDSSLFMASVGQETIDGKACRWIEVKLAEGENGVNGIKIVKALVPEEHLGKGKDPISHVVRAWYKDSSNEPVPLEYLAKEGILPIAMGGPLKEVAELETEVMDTKLGKLPCDGVSGFIELRYEMYEGRFLFKTRLHEKAPFGVVASSLTIEVRLNGQLINDPTAEFTLSDFGEAALTELPGFE